MALLEQIENKKGLVIASKLQILNMDVELYGEIHNDIPSGENFYTNLTEILKKNKNCKILIEHSTLLNNFNEIQYKYYKTITKGIDNLYFELMLYHNKHIQDNNHKDNINEPICIDNRMEEGCPTAIEETILLKSILEMFKTDLKVPENLVMLIQMINSVIKFIDKYLPNFSRLTNTVKEFYEGIYEVIIETIRREYKILQLIAKLPNRETFITESGFFKEERENRDIICIAMYSAVKNMQKLGSLVVDVNIIKTIIAINDEYESDMDDIERLKAKKKKRGKIIILTGYAHIARITQMIVDSELLFEHADLQQYADPLEFCNSTDSENEFISKLEKLS